MKLQQKDIEKILSILGYAKINSFVTEFEVTFDKNTDPYLEPSLEIHYDNITCIECESGYCSSTFFDDSLLIEFKKRPEEDSIICEVCLDEGGESKTVLRGYHDNVYFYISLSETMTNSHLLFNLFRKIRNKRIIFDQLSEKVIFSDEK